MRRLIARLTHFPLFGLLVITTSQESFAYATNLFQQTNQEQRGTGSGAGGENDVRALEPGKPQKRELAGGQRHAYRIRLNADQFLKAVIEQDGIDVVARLSGPDGKQIMEFDSESRPRGRETVSQVAESEGEYLLVVEPKLKRAQAGSYKIRIEELRAVTESDRALQEARNLYKKGIDLLRAGKYDEAIPVLERALVIRERVLGINHTDVADAINSLAKVHTSKGEYSKGEALFRRALIIREKWYGPEHPDVADSINGLANIFKFKGDYVKAEPLYQRAVAIGEGSLGPEHPVLAILLMNLASIHQYKNENAKAEALLQRAVAIQERSLGQHPDVAMPINNLANLYARLGDYAKAEPLFLRTLAIYEKSLGPEHPQIGIAALNLGNLYSQISDYAKAEPFYQRAHAIFEKSLGPEHHLFAVSLNNQASRYRILGDYAKAQTLFQRALAILEKAFGPEHPDIAVSLSSIAGLCRITGDYTKSELLYQRALAIREKSLAPEHSEVAVTLNDLAKLYMAKHDIAQAIAFKSRADGTRERSLKLNLAIGSERQKLAQLATLTEQTDQTLTLHLRYAPDDPAARNLAIALILQRKGRALDAAFESLNGLRSRFNDEDRALLDELTDARSQIARLVLDGPRNMTAEQYRGRIKTIVEQADKIEAEISRRSDEFRAQSLPVTLDAVREAIPDDAALIEFASYRSYNPRTANDDEAYGPPNYVAYVLRRQGKIQWKELGDAKAIDVSVARLRVALRDPRRRDIKHLARVVDRKVFQPLIPLLGDQTRLLISPEGMLNLVPFAALVDGGGRYRVERYSISYLSSGRDLLRLQVARKSQNGPLVIADPDFGKRREAQAARKLKQTNGPKKQSEKESPASAFSHFYFTALPHTAEEGEALRSMLPGATLLTKRSASKSALLRSRSPELLHIATHGFFLEDLKLNSTGNPGARKSALKYNRRLKQVRPVLKNESQIDNPLLRAGLALAGANERKEGDNGILTALELTGLNLWGTKLVALSACDTGVGEVRSGDGVHGLRRALTLAGAETHVMSLWPVSDRWTRELMVAYYQRLMRGEGRGEALRQAQLEMLKNVKRRSPYYWAGFILSGEWANLDGKRGK
jgi:CHAT domain-containing protein